MPKGPKGEKRPADAVSRAVQIARIAIGEEADAPAPDGGKDPSAQALGAKGGKARAENLSAAKRSAIAKKAAEKRWKRSGK